MPDGSTPITTPPTSASLKYHEPGIYFGMTEEIYFGDASLGSSDAKNLTTDIEKFWEHSRFNPNRPDTETDAKLKGQALHKLVLEGEAAFDKAFTVDMVPENHPGALVTGKDLEAFCRNRKIAGYSGKAKADLIAMIKREAPEAIIFDEIYATFLAMAQRDGKKILKPKVAEEVRQAAAAMSINEHLANAFSGGPSEVSIFWRDEHGIPCKARIDKLKPRTLVDLKKSDNLRGRSFAEALRRDLVAYRYDIQAEHYFQGYAHLFEFAREGRIFGDCPLRADWGQRIADPEAIEFTWVFRSTVGAPICKGVRLPRTSPVLNRARREIAEGKRLYLDCMERFGPDQMWVSNTPIAELGETDFPRSFSEDAEVLS